jgi:hypothetical protein
MANANSSINIAELDFDTIKNNFKKYLEGQDKFSDYNFESSVISTVLDILAYNTHYNAYYLNMVANESFLDTAVKRSSTVSHAKLLNYTPSSKRASKAIIDIKFNGVSAPSLFLPKYTKFYSQAINNTNYPFVTLESTIATTSNGIVQFSNIPIYQGQPVRYTFNVNTLQNPECMFTIPDTDVDTTTLSILVYDSSQSTVFNKFELASNHLTLDSTSQVYFLQEGLDGSFQFYFGDGVLGKSLTNGNVVTIEYISTDGMEPNGAYRFTLMDKIGNYSGTIITATEVASGGQQKESIQSIKYSAPKAYAAQNRAVTKSDYLELLKRDNPIIPIQSVNVWGGEDVTPAQFGKMFICIKPNGGYSLSASQKYRLINEYIKPFSIVTITPEIVDVDYTFVKISSNIYFDANRSIFDSVQLASLLKLGILDFCNRTLNTFDSVFVLPDLITTIKNIDASIITSESAVILQKRFTPIFSTTNSHTYNFETAIKKGTLDSDYFDYIDPISEKIYTNVKIEESPSVYNTIESVQIISGGTGYSSVPLVTIYGDGTGAIATADVTNGSIVAINITSQGLNYTQAVAVISGGGGSGAIAVPVLSGNIVTLRSYYYANNIKTVLQSYIGQINYTTGNVVLTGFTPYNINNLLGQFSVSVTPESTIFSSTKDKIITLDIMDDSAITINVRSKV